jgi:hypothetical protein
MAVLWWVMMKKPTEAEFKTAVSDAAVMVIFQPTKSTYTFYRLADPNDIRRYGPIMSEPDNAQRNGHNRFTELRRLGIAKFAASVAAGSPTGLWRMSGHPAVQHALRNQVFDSLGLPRIFMPVPA